MNGIAKIDKGIPVPIHGNQKKWPFPQMEVGDSFAAPLASRGALSAAYKKFPGRKFIGRKVQENGEAVIRVWRVE